jgi:hypothetical protein
MTPGIPDEVTLPDQAVARIPALLDPGAGLDTAAAAVARIAAWRAPKAPLERAKLRAERKAQWEAWR